MLSTGASWGPLHGRGEQEIEGGGDGGDLGTVALCFGYFRRVRVHLSMSKPNARSAEQEEEDEEQDEDNGGGRKK